MSKSDQKIMILVWGSYSTKLIGLIQHIESFYVEASEVREFGITYSISSSEKKSIRKFKAGYVIVGEEIVPFCHTAFIRRLKCRKWKYNKYEELGIIRYVIEK